MPPENNNEQTEQTQQEQTTEQQTQQTQEQSQQESQTQQITTEQQNQSGNQQENQQQASEALTWDSFGDQLPEGFDKENPLAGEFLEVMNDSASTPVERGQKLLGLYSKVNEMFEANEAKVWLDLNDQWQKDLVTQYGSEEALDKNLGKVSSLIEAYAKDAAAKAPRPAPGETVRDFAKEVREAATLTGAGNNPAFVSMLIWVADQFGEGGPLTGSPPVGERSRAQTLFGQTPNVT